MDRTQKKAAVIGAGLGGISAAGYLAGLGWKVDVFESQGFPGGKAGELEMQGFRFDTGPSLVTMKDVFLHYFSRLSFDISGDLNFSPLEQICTYYYPDGTVLKSSGNREIFAARLHESFGTDPDCLNRFLDHGKAIYAVSAPVFLYGSIHDMPKWNMIKRMTPRNLSVLRPWFSMTKDISRFFTDPREVQLFQRYATYNGSDPYQVPATLNIIPHVEYDLGAFAALPSIHAIPRTMEKAAKNRGVKFYYGHTVETIHYDRRSIRGITAAGETVPYDAVVSNADVIYTYENLLQGFNSKYYRRYKKLEPSTSGVVFYWGINRSFTELGLHNIFFSRDYRKEFHQLFREKNLPDDPTVYINITSKVQNNDAPEGRENWFVLINAPSGREDFSGEEIGTLRSKIIRKIAEGLGISPAEIKQSICFEDTLTPRQIGERTKTSRGSLYGIASNNPFAAFLRHPNRSRDLRGLYFCGGSAHPGGGMPLSVLSGKITAELVNSGAEI